MVGGNRLTAARREPEEGDSMSRVPLVIVVILVITIIAEPIAAIFWGSRGVTVVFVSGLTAVAIYAAILNILPRREQEEGER